MSQELYEKRIGHVERDVAEMRGRLAGVEDKLDGVKGAVGDVKSAIDKLVARDVEQRARTPYDVRDMLDMTLKAGLIAGLVVSAIIYVASGHSAVDLALLKERVGQLGARPWVTTTLPAKR